MIASVNALSKIALTLRTRPAYSTQRPHRWRCSTARRPPHLADPTPHLAHLSTGASVYTWCVLDTFILAGLFACDVQIESRPPLAAAPLNVSLISNTLTASPEFVVSFPLTCDENGTHFTEAFCPFANLFPTIEHYRHWAPLQPRPTVAISVDRANSIAADFALDIRTNTIKSSDLSLSL
ncbi:organomercurial lyase [Corynebacterium pseudotuberculosis]|uniref:organomercurial lyase n=1 Tax=Corynebacterium pseudotuberculosis TaxID=1719 RepID=UPI002F266659